MADRRYNVSLQPTARRELASLAVAVRRSIGRAIEALAIEPRPTGSKLLAGRPAERIWRMRVGDYRVLYEIHDAELVVLVLRVGHRREVYRNRPPRG
jgi:mRNA interferase RelE/StbE